MKSFILLSTVCIGLLGIIVPLRAEVFVSMTFILHEPDYKTIAPLNAVITSGKIPQPTTWPGFMENDFNAYWIIDSLGDYARGDTLPIPPNIPPYTIDYVINFQLEHSQTDTLVINWDSLPNQIDSIHIEDIGYEDTGKFFSKSLYHTENTPDSLEYFNPQLVNITYFLVRIYYNASVESPNSLVEWKNIPETSSLSVSPNPSNNYIMINSSGNSTYSRLVLYNELGEAVKTVSMGIADNLQPLYRMDLSGVPSGIYTVAAYDGARVTTAQVAVIK